MVGRLPGVTAAFGPGMVSMDLQGDQSDEFAITFTGALPTLPQGSALEKSQSNYLLGNDPKLWRTHVANYGRVNYAELYPGIDAVFYGTGQLLEHDFVVAPGADYRQIRMHLSENARAKIDKDGDLTITISGGELRMHKPVIYQDIQGTRELRTGSFRLLQDGDIGFAVASYDRGRALVIDPVLSFSTYLTTEAVDIGGFIATDSNGNSYLTGVTDVGFPVTPGAFPGCGTCPANMIETYVSKLSADGKTLIYSTLVGGNNYTQPYGISVDANGNALVTGRTQASDFPTKNGQPTGAVNGTAFLGFVASLSPDGSSLNYGTMLGGVGSSGQGDNTSANAIAVDNAGNAYVAGGTNSGFFPNTPGAANSGTPNGYASQVFLSKFGPTGILIYSAFLGCPDPQNGGDGPTGPFALTVDSSGEAYVAGQAGSLWPTTSGAYIRQIPGPQPYAAPFVTKVAPDGGSVLYSTYLDYAYQVAGIVVLSGGEVFVAGWGAESAYPTTPNAYQPSSSTAANSFLTELDAAGSSLVYATVLGDATYYLNALALDPDGDLWVAGQTASPQFPLVTPLQSAFPFSELFPGSASTLSQFDPTGTMLKFSTFLGGTSSGQVTGLAIDINHRAHVAGASESGFYTTPGVYRPQVPTPASAYQTSLYPYAALIDTTVAAPALCVNPNTTLYWYAITAGTYQDQPLTITNCGTLPLNVSGFSPAAGVFTVPVAENGCTQTLPVGQSCTLSVRYSPTTAETDNSTLTLQSNASMTQAVLPLNGTGVVPKLVVFSNPIFNYTVVGQTSAAGQLFLQNAGGAPLTLNLANTKISGDFSLQGLGSCTTIQATQMCTLPIYFTPTAPGTRTGTLQIASNDPANPTVSVSLQATGYSGAPVPQISGLSTQLVPAGVGQTQFQVNGFGFLPSSIVQLNGVPQQTTYQSETSLQATLAASSIPANAYGEIAVTVVTPAPGGGQSAPYTLTEFQTIAIQSAFLVYEPVGKQLYASIPAASTTSPNTVLPINPVSATAGTPITVGNDPGVLAVSSDGTYLYVALNADHTIQRINLSTLAIERTFALPVDPQFGNLQVIDMHVVPGSPTEVVASLKVPTLDPPEDGVALFNDAGLVNWIPGVPPAATGSQIDNFAFTSNPGTIYAIDVDHSGLYELTLDSTGIHAANATCCTPPDAYSVVVSDGSLLYTGSGAVWNPVTNQLVSTYVFPVPPPAILDSVIPDASTGKTYFLNAFGNYDYYDATSILAFDQASLAETGSLSITAFNNNNVSGTQLVRWGANGFAFRPEAASSPSTAVLLFTSSIASASNVTASPVATTLAPASVPAAGADFTLTVTGSNFIPGSTVEWNGTPRLTTVVSPTQLTATIYAADIAAMGTAQVIVLNPGNSSGTTLGNGTGVSAALPFTITAALPPPAPAVTLSPTNLTFAVQAVASSSAAQSVSLTNGGNADLTGVTISLSGPNATSFEQTNTCGTTVSAGKSCTINVVFTPGSASAFAATVIIKDNAASSPQSIALAGTGTATVFTIAPQTASGTTATVPAGQPASYALSLTPVAGYSGTVTLSCTGLPANATCSFTPSSLALTGGKAANFTVTLATETAQTSGQWRPYAGSALAGLLLLLPLPLCRQRRSRARWLSLILLLSAGIGFSGCGGGGGGSTNPVTPAPAMVAPGTYTIQLVASDGTTTQKQPLTLVVM